MGQELNIRPIIQRDLPGGVCIALSAVRLADGIEDRELRIYKGTRLLASETIRDHEEAMAAYWWAAWGAEKGGTR